MSKYEQLEQAQKEYLEAILLDEGFTPEEIEEAGYLEHDFGTTQYMIQYWEEDHV